MFTTRPEIQGTFGVVATTHWLASSTGMAMLERGGNAFDAAVAAAFVLNVVEPHLVGPAGDAPIVFYPAKSGKAVVLCGQAPAPAGATIARYKQEGLDLIPSNGLLATVIPGAFDAWMLLLRDHGRLSLRETLEPAIRYAGEGHPILPRISQQIATLQPFFEQEWPSSAATYLPGGKPPVGGALFRNEVLAATWRRLIDEAEATGLNREGVIDAARDVFYRGFVAEAIGDFAAGNAVMDQSGTRHRGVITAGDMAGWHARYEAPATYSYQGFDVCKTGPWGQGPAFLQTLAILKGFDLSAMGPNSAEFVHVVTEAMKLAFADRDVYYGDPDFVTVPLETLLSDSYAAERRALIGGRASRDFRPGTVPGYEDLRARTIAMLERANARGLADTGAEPTNAEMRAAQQASAKRGDTVHIDVVDSEGNMLAAMPSGGWLQSSPVIPSLGFPLNSRAQMFWLEEGMASSLAPGKRPRTTLTPSLVMRGGKPYMAFGSPGGDAQEQWALMAFLRHVHHGLTLQEAIEQPMWQTGDLHSSFYPRTRMPGHLLAEDTFGPEVLSDLTARGHDVKIAPAWTIGRLVGVYDAGDGILRGAATPRLVQAYAVGR